MARQQELTSDKFPSLCYHQEALEGVEIFFCCKSSTRQMADLSLSGKEIPSWNNTKDPAGFVA